MAQQIYGNVNGKQKKRGKKILIILICAAAVVIIGLAAIGLTLGSQSSERTQISDAIAENTQLRQQVDELYDEIDSLNEEIARLGGELESRPTIEPESTGVPEDEILGIIPTSTPSIVSPRSY